MKKNLQYYWDRISDTAIVVADFQAKVILSLLYFVVALPTGLIVRLTDDVLAMRRRPGSASHWQARPTHPDSLPKARHQG
jgi:hypothetical protein